MAAACLFDPQTEQFKRYQHDPKRPLYQPGAGHVRRRGCRRQPWFGTELKGVNRFDRKTERFERYLPDPASPGSLSHRTVKNIYLDRQGTLWVATGRTMVKYQGRIEPI